MIKIKPDKVWVPNYVADSVFELDIKELKKIGITHLIFDVDNTLIIGRVETLSEETTAHIASLRKAGFTIYVGSNSRRNISAIVQSMHAKVARSHGLTFKPRKKFYYQVIQEAAITPDHIAMVGDHLLNDVIGPNRVGLTTVLIKSLNNKPRNINHMYINHLLKSVKKTD